MEYIGFGARSMNKVKSVLRLAAATSVPSKEQLQEMLKSAQQNKSCVLLMPWTNDEQKLFALTCMFDLSTEISLTKKEQDMIGEPRWTLHSGLETTGPVIWNHTTGDVELVINLLKMENKNGNDDDAAKLKKKQAPPDQSTVITKTMSGFPLSGELKDVIIADVLNSIKSAKMSGRLDISTNSLSTEVYFNSGQPVHADLQKTLAEDDSKTTGDRAFLEMLTWKAGTFKFHRGRTTTLCTITKQLDDLCKAANCLQEYDNYLTEAGLSEDSFLIRSNSEMTDEELNEKFKGATPSYVSVVRQFYSQIDNVSTLYEILNRSQMCRTAWLPIVHRLHTLALVNIAHAPGKKCASAPAAPRSITKELFSMSPQGLKVVELEHEQYVRLQAMLKENPELTEAMVTSKAIGFYLDKYDELKKQSS